MSLPADPSRIRLSGALLAGALCLALPAAAGTWSFPISTGYDLYIHDYYLSDTDTTEVIQELNVTASANGTSRFGDRHRWYVRAGVSGGTELYRESLDAGFRLRTEDRQEWLRGEVLLLARQFRDDSEYSLSSDNHEGRVLAAVTPWTGLHAALEIRTRGRYVDYADPSTLEVDYGQASAGTYLRSPNGTDQSWRVGGAAIDALTACLAAGAVGRRPAAVLHGLHRQAAALHPADSPAAGAVARDRHPPAPGRARPGT